MNDFDDFEHVRGFVGAVIDTGPSAMRRANRDLIEDALSMAEDFARRGWKIRVENPEALQAAIDLMSDYLDEMDANSPDDG